MNSNIKYLFGSALLISSVWFISQTGAEKGNTKEPQLAESNDIYSQPRIKEIEDFVPTSLPVRAEKEHIEKTHLAFDSRVFQASVEETDSFESTSDENEANIEEFFIEGADLFLINNAPYFTSEFEPTSEDFANHGYPITIQDGAIASLQEGQLLTFPLDGGTEMEVKSIENRKNGKSKVTFSFPNTDAIHRGFLTVGKVITTGRFVTPEATYEIELVNGSGWIVDTRHIDNRWPEDGIDYVAHNNRH